MPILSRYRICFLTCLFFFFFCKTGRTQILDGFSDGDFTANPAWQGDVANFVVNAAGELQLMAPAAGASILTVPGTIPDNATWALRVHLDFAPSTGNLLRVYLLADQADLLAANGYFLEIGENGSLDALRLFRQDGAVKTLLGSGTAGLVALEPVEVLLRVKRSGSGVWSLDAGPTSTTLQPQFVVQDATYTGGSNQFFGLYCLYTATRTDKFFFDDLAIEAVPDTEAPQLVSAQADDATHVRVIFDENLDSLAAVNTAHYSITPGSVPIASAVVLADKRSVQLNLSSPLNSGVYTLQTDLIADALGNVGSAQMTEFQYVQQVTLAEFDVIINEIQSDPSPSAGLPEVEWIELYNRSEKTIELSALQFDDGGLPKQLPAYTLLPDTYVVLATASAAAALSPFASNTLAVSGFPSLNNDGDVLTLSSTSGLVLDRVAYSLDWHTDLLKKLGGWTLERINPGTPCLGAENWQSCPALPGGTPGKVNAAVQLTPDQTAPRLVSVFPDNATTLRLRFSEGLDRNKAENIAAYHLTPARTISTAVQTPGDRTEVLLTLADALQSGTVYTITVDVAVEDCSGNGVASTDIFQIGLPEIPEPQDIIINEILFNPAVGGARYVEVYNRSNKIFNWQDFYLANFYFGANITPIGLPRLFLPGQYDVFTTSPADIKLRFANIHPENVLSLVLPSFSDILGNATIYWSKGGATVVVDSFDYNANMHNALFSTSDRDGVALERIRSDGPTNQASNWTSASTILTGNYGSPTLPNSQGLQSVNPADELIHLPVARLSPDDDGYEDFLNIEYTLPESGYAATTTIFDSEGIPVRHLVRLALIGTEGGLRWDGDADDGERARPGIYILYMELFLPNGEVKRVKKPFALVKRF